MPEYNSKLKVSRGWKKLNEEISRKISDENEVKRTGGNKYKQLEARLGHTKTGQIDGDIVVYALQTITNPLEIKDFYDGFVADVETHQGKYPVIKTSAREYVKSDINIALFLNFRNPETYKLWNNVLKFEE